MFNLIDRHLASARYALGCAALLALSGCNAQLFTPRGDIGVQEKNLILIASALMLLVVIPVIGMTLYFAWRCRAGNTKATYAPKWNHSTTIEIVIWTIPCVIVAILGVLIWDTTHKLDPYQPIKSARAPLRVQVVALNWKWLFIYPDYGVASVNQLHVPVDTPLEFKLTAASLMNSFFIPRLGSQVYAMSGMQTQLSLIANHAGTYNGMSAAFSGEGFSDMHFDAVATSEQEFQGWVAQVKRSPLKLDQVQYATLAQPGNGHPVAVYADVAPGLFDSVVNQYMHGNMAGGDTTAAAIAAELCRVPGSPISTLKTAEQ
jgi:cytochrome o ubiquinol oxidase subunit 2